MVEHGAHPFKDNRNAYLRGDALTQATLIPVVKHLSHSVHIVGVVHVLGYVFHLQNIPGWVVVGYSVRVGELHHEQDECNINRAHVVGMLEYHT